MGYHFELIAEGHTLATGVSIHVTSTDTVVMIREKVANKLNNTGSMKNINLDMLDISLNYVGPLDRSKNDKTLLELGIPDGGILMCTYKIKCPPQST